MYRFQIQHPKSGCAYVRGPSGPLVAHTKADAQMLRDELTLAHGYPVWIIDMSGLSNPRHGKKAANEALNRAAKWRLKAARALRTGKPHTAANLIGQARREVALAEGIRSRGYNLAA